MSSKDISKEIVKLLRRTKFPVTTRYISKRVKIGWSTAFVYCIRLKIEGKINGTKDENYQGNGEGRHWSYKR